MSRLASEIRKRHDFDSPQQEAMLNIVRTAALVSEPFERLFKSHGVSSPLYNILRILRGVGSDGVASGEIGPQMVSPAPDVTRLVDRLEKLDLATRQRSDEDRRVVMVKLAPKGRRLLKKLDPLVADLHSETFAHLSATELRSINELMVRARESLGK